VRRAASHKLGKYLGLLTVSSTSSDTSSGHTSIELGPAFIYTDDPLMNIDAPTIDGKHMHSWLQLECHTVYTSARQFAMNMY
jgi:hypothetical protein